MNKIELILETIVSEQPDNNQINEMNSAFTDAEERFLGMFDKHQTNNLGILYSTSDTGVREFIARSGSMLNLTPQVLLSLMKNNIVKIVPHGGRGRNVDYTIQLNLNLADIKGLAAKTGDEEESDSDTTSSDTSSSSSSGGFSGGGMTTADLETGDLGGEDTGTDTETPETETPEAGTEEAPAEEPTGELPDLETAGVMKYGDILRESVTLAKRIITEKKKSDKHEIKVYDKESRLLNRLPQGYVYQLKRIIEMLAKQSNSVTDKERIIADVLDNLQVNFELEPKHITKAYEFHRNQKRLQKYLNKK